MATKREYLVSLGLANPTRGRFKKEALAALDAAIAKGIVFDEPAVPAPKAKPVSLVKVVAPQAKVKVILPQVDSKAVRQWALKNGVAVGARGRIHPTVIQAFVQAGGKVDAPAAPTGQSARPTPAAMPKVRPQTQAWAITKFKADKPSDRPFVLGVDKCGKGHQISQCPCPVPSTSADWGNVPLVFVKPVL